MAWDGVLKDIEVDGRLKKKVLSAGQQIAAAIKESILDGSLPPGAQLPSEEEMAENFGVSRPTIRSALHRLRDQELIAVTRGRHGGYRVAEFSADAIARGVSEYMTLAMGARKLTYADVVEVRSILEVLSARAAAARRTGEDLESLAELEETAGLDGRETWTIHQALGYDMALHRKLAEFSHNPLILAFSSVLALAFRDCDLNLTTLSPPTVIAHLDEIRDAVVLGDGDAAAAAMTRHLAVNAPQS